MPREFVLPDLGEGIHEGEIIDVLVPVGGKVSDGQPFLVVETDKATVEIPSPVTGTVKEIRVKPGDLVKVGQVLAVFLEAGEAGEKERAGAPPVEAGAGPAAVRPAPEASIVEKLPELPGIRGVSPAAAGPVRAQDAPEAGGREPVPAAPSTRRLARELGVDLRSVPPGGPGGRVTSEDVRAFAETAAKGAKASRAAPKPAAAPSPPSSAPSGPGPQVPPLPDFSRWGTVERIPLRSVRRSTARHMALAWSQVPHVTHQDEADVTDLEALRRRHKTETEALGGSLSLTVFALKAAVAALKANPRFNASLDTETEEIVLKRYYHLGVAVDSERGLIVPTIRDVDRKSLTELSIELNEIAARTREGKVDREELQGGTFTLTNIGVLGGTGFTPIVNYPQVAILGMGRAACRPTVIGHGDNREIAPRLILPLILGFDHRVVDGADAARFLNIIIDELSNPERLMMNM